MIPSSTYRLQFRNGMTFDIAAALVPYLAELGVSHLYASPVFTAAQGSTHGYDVTDYNELDPTLGGREGFERLSAALKAAGLGLVLDIVPNHMAASLENPWWRSVVEWGKDSPCAGHFDIDWKERLTLPTLGKPFDQVLADGELRVTVDRQAGALALTYFDNSFPLHPESYAPVLEGVDHPAAARLAEAARAARSAEAGAFHAEVRRLLEDAHGAAALDQALERLPSERIADIHDRQPWRLLFWQDARRHLSYRRFFEITGLVGVRVEDEAVFRDSHRLILGLVASGAVDGLRIDHVDGLADPGAYLERLREAVGDDTYIVVEKILGPGESLPAGWPVSGTTGYEFIAALASGLVEAPGVETLRAAYGELDRRGRAPADDLRDSKRLILTRNFAGELDRLVALARQEMGPEAPSGDTLCEALVELITAFTVYRTYGTGGGMGGPDRALLATAAGHARPHLGDATALDRLVGLLKGDDNDAATAELRTRFQQLSGPIMAKAMEDTFFYRYGAVLGLNEVGGEAFGDELSVERLHGYMAERVRTQPVGLSATATHDTKRGEDSRARLYALSEDPGDWIAAVERWRSNAAGRIQALEKGPAPEPAVEWMLYQALLGAWPGRDRLEGLGDRMAAFLEKALREAKLRTDWLDQDAVYEKAVRDYLEAQLADEDFLADFDRTAAPYVHAGLLSGLAQTLLKLVGPGIPDIYQGTEGIDLSLVDPDNRRIPDFVQLARSLREAAPSPHAALTGGAFKQRLVATCLRMRRAHRDFFRKADYQPLAAHGAQAGRVLAFARTHGDDWLIGIAPRTPLALLSPDHPFIEPSRWADTVVAVPASLRGAAVDMVTGRTVTLEEKTSMAELLGHAPVACLVPPSLTRR
jgi:(1->4)-alpha-D-glucan 1-alpha-D-glucosylmutase